MGNANYSNQWACPNICGQSFVNNTGFGTGWHAGRVSNCTSCITSSFGLVPGSAAVCGDWWGLSRFLSNDACVCVWMWMDICIYVYIVCIMLKADCIYLSNWFMLVILDNEGSRASQVFLILCNVWSYYACMIFHPFFTILTVVQLSLQPCMGSGHATLKPRYVNHLSWKNL